MKKETEDLINSVPELQNVSMDVFHAIGGLIEQVDKRSEIRKAFAEYYESEGCECCQSKDHGEHEDKLAELLDPPRYDDDSGWDWYKLK